MIHESSTIRDGDLLLEKELEPQSRFERFLYRHLRRYDILKTVDGQARLYLRRFHILKSPDRGIKLHRIILSDLDRDMHDHPWNFVSIMLHGSYVEHTPQGSRRYIAPTVIRHKAEDLHKLTLDCGEVWTLVFTGRKRRTWGFQTPDGWVPWRNYLGVSATEAPESDIE
jgi:hypothetical protein